LRGLAGGNLRVRVLSEGVHSGDASGIVPSSFRILRDLISRVEDPKTGKISVPELNVEIPAERLQQAQTAAASLGAEVYSKFPFVDGMKPATDNPAELVLNRTWRPTLSVIGMDGFPAMSNAGNVLRPFTSAKLSFRLPPTADAYKATDALKAALEKDPPYGAHVEFKVDGKEAGWNAPAMADWLTDSIARASTATFGKPAAMMGEGGSIPFMGMLGKKFPRAQFMITGVLGPHSNAHGPNEFLHIPTGKKVSSAVALVLADHFRQGGAG
jgi:acetylornithine deacetylase/succinyl-diaminopimelate desuccinylase-like protein